MIFLSAGVGLSAGGLDVAGLGASGLGAAGLGVALRGLRAEHLPLRLHVWPPAAPEGPPLSTLSPLSSMGGVAGPEDPGRGPGDDVGGHALLGRKGFVKRVEYLAEVAPGDVAAMIKKHRDILG